MVPAGGVAGRFAGRAAHQKKHVKHVQSRQLARSRPLGAGEPHRYVKPALPMLRRRIRTSQHVGAEPEDKREALEKQIPDVLATADAILGIDRAIPNDGVELRNVAEETVESLEEVRLVPRS